jgi:quinol monooxygenase YgiN
MRVGSVAPAPRCPDERRFIVYGTVARTRVKPENRAALKAIFERQLAEGSPPGFVGGYTLLENDSDTAWLVAIFEDRASYDKNADEPRQHEQYVAYRALMEDEPEWHDGEIEGM